MCTGSTAGQFKQPCVFILLTYCELLATGQRIYWWSHDTAKQPKGTARHLSSEPRMIPREGNLWAPPCAHLPHGGPGLRCSFFHGEPGWEQSRFCETSSALCKCLRSLSLGVVISELVLFSLLNYQQVHYVFTPLDGLKVLQPYLYFI